MDTISTPRTTETSKDEGRLRVDVGGPMKKKKKDLVKSVVKKYGKVVNIK